MNKKLLLCVAMNCPMVHAIITHVDKEDSYTRYTRQQSIAYQKVLVDALAGNEKAIDEEDQKNKKANDDEEAESRKQQYDGNPGIWATAPSINSEIGRKYHEYAQHKQKKNTINEDLSKDTKDKKKLFDEKVLLGLASHLESSRYFMVNNCLSALHDCGADLSCYDEKGLSSKIFTDDTFGLQYEQREYVSGTKIAAEKGITLTPEEIKTVVTGNPKTKDFVQDIKDGIEKISEARKNILDQKK
ncbi:MAG TPA: hypothetical protein VHX42_02755 [Candidatus Babeliales bacterium]|jgi:hypothetical protein|nr:hypothetical protein [Candidatus Babeliales bacterium]